MKMAMPRAGEFDKVLEFLQGVECIIEHGCLPEEVNELIDAENPTVDEQMDWIVSFWEKSGVSLCWERVLWAGKTVIDAACDPTQTTLEWKPKIKAAMEAAGLET